MPVATKATVKTLSSHELIEIGTQALIANAFLLYLRPGMEVLKKAGGLHDFMNWNRAIFTDSGGFQILNDELLMKIDDSGVIFKSPFDGSKHEFTPEKCAQVQMELGSDIAMVLDDCPSYGISFDEVRVSTKRTFEWAKRFKKSHNKEDQLVFGIVQGGVFNELRADCAKALKEMNFDGYAIGGLSIGEPKEVMNEVVRYNSPMLPEDKPRYLMGVGSPEDILEAISFGIDIFDSAFPTRNARHNTIYTKNGKINLGKEHYNKNLGPLDEGCGCYTCKNYSLSYVNHLLREFEWLGLRLTTIHNLYFLESLMKEARNEIEARNFSNFKEKFLKKYLKK
jgi:queuine tRNA-ribosyltransferase